MLKLTTFFFPAVSDTWLTILRLGCGLQVFLYCLSSQRDWQQLYARQNSGLLGRDLAEDLFSLESPWSPRIGWLASAGEKIGLGEHFILGIVWLLLLSAGLCLLLGFFCRFAASLAWFVHLCAIKSAALTSYGMDNFTTIGLFYLMIAPLPDRWSLDAKVRRLKTGNAHRQGFHRRILQLHLSIIYFFSGLTKAFGPDWWDGQSIWHALTRVPFNAVSPNLLAEMASVFPFLGIGIIFLETSYPFFIWPRRTCRFCLAAIIVLHLSVGLMMGLYLFALIMIVLNLSAFYDSPRRPIPEPELLACHHD